MLATTESIIEADFEQKETKLYEVAERSTKKPSKILIFDSDLAFCRQVRKLGAARRLSVVICFNPSDFWHLFLANPSGYDLVIVDVDLLPKLKASFHYSKLTNVPLLLSSAHKSRRSRRDSSSRVFNKHYGAAALVDYACLNFHNQVRLAHC